MPPKQIVFQTISTARTGEASSTQFGASGKPGNETTRTTGGVHSQRTSFQKTDRSGDAGTKFEVEQDGGANTTSQLQESRNYGCDLAFSYRDAQEPAQDSGESLARNQPS